MYDTTQQRDRVGDDESQFLTFRLGDESYGVDILRVQEIKGYTGVTKIPNAPPYIKGILNLRGTIVPIVELRTRFSMPTVEYTMFTVIVVVVLGTKTIGLVVDTVSDVLQIAKKDIQPAPEFGSSVDVTFLDGIGKSNDQLVAFLNIDRLMNSVDARVMQPVAA
ncbi:MAG: chemotaxis protein CheW [Nitrospiraceae bacterium]